MSKKDNENEENEKDKNITLSKTTMQGIQTLFYIFHVVFILTCIAFVINISFLTFYHIIFLEFVGIACIVSGKYDFDYSDNKESDDDE